VHDIRDIWFLPTAENQIGVGIADNPADPTLRMPALKNH
jgi:hypothetical protein